MFVSCDPRDRTPDAELVQRYPQLVVEVSSDSTAAFDRGQKFEAYRSLDSLAAYLLVEQHRPHADLFICNVEGRWVLNPVGEGGTLTISSQGNVALPLSLIPVGDGRLRPALGRSIGVELPLAAVYDGVAFGVQAPAGAR